MYKRRMYTLVGAHILLYTMRKSGDARDILFYILLFKLNRILWKVNILHLMRNLCFIENSAYNLLLLGSVCLCGALC